MLRTSELEYELPEELLATEPVSPRDSARLMVVDRGEPSRIRHATVRELPGVLRPGDLLVFNTTRVLPARFFGERVGTRGKVEGLFLSDLPVGTEGEIARWIVLLRGRHTRVGAEVAIKGSGGGAAGWILSVLDRHEPGAWVVSVRGPAGSTPEILERFGHTPLPPYIVRARQHAQRPGEEPGDRERYQTVYSREPGSVAAPTAGLHFTPELLGALAARGVGRADVLLHVGAGTFKPVETDLVEDHPMHSEWCSMTPESVRAVTAARQEGRRVIAVGTTAARTLEAYAAAVESSGEVPPSVETRLLITPGYRFRWVDGLMTNFHLPRSTLMALVAALLPGVPELRRLYEVAIAERYRFYSYGDAMLIV